MSFRSLRRAASLKGVEVLGCFRGCHLLPLSSESGLIEGSWHRPAVEPQPVRFRSLRRAASLKGWQKRSVRKPLA